MTLLSSFLFLGACPNCAKGVDYDEGQETVIDSCLPENKNPLHSFLHCPHLLVKTSWLKTSVEENARTVQRFDEFVVRFESFRLKERGMNF